MNNNQLSIYYHIWSPPNSDLWRFLIDEQLKRIYRSDILNKAQFYCGISGSQCEKIAKFVSVYDWVNILEVSNDEDYYEGFTLKYLYQDCINNDNLKVLYFHNKGISHFDELSDNFSDRKFRAINSWRHFMEWGVIDRWREAIDKLHSADVCGVNYTRYPWPHISGNFWWSKASYIKTLIHPTRDIFPTHPADDIISQFISINRANYEKWIGMNNPNVFSFLNLPIMINGKELPPDIDPAANESASFWLYRDDIEPHYRNAIL